MNYLAQLHDALRRNPPAVRAIRDPTPLKLKCEMVKVRVRFRVTVGVKVRV